MATLAKGAMASSLPSWADVSWDMIPDPSVKPLPYLVTAFLAIVLVYSLQASVFGVKNPIPLLNPRRPFEFTDTRAKKDFVFGSKKMLGDWFGANPDKPVRLISGFGEVTVLPPHLANELRNDNRLDFSKWTYKAFHAQIPGFDGFKEGTRDTNIVQAVILKDLTKYLNKLTEPLAEETAFALAELLPTGDDDKDNCTWHSIPLRETMLRLIARISSRVFLGEELCRDEAWLKVTREYTVDSFKAAEELRLWPAASRFIVHHFLASCRKIRTHVREARRTIAPVLARRREEKLRNPELAFNDALEWFEQAAKGEEYDPAIAQLVISLAAIHTTTDLVCQTLTELVRHPSIIPALRAEITTALRDGGWKKTSLYNMKLLDSVIKETQRVKPISLVSMNRVALSTVELSDGTVIPRDSLLNVSMHKMWDPAVHANPAAWDGYRFLRMRETPGREHQAQLVSTGPDHLGFGHGQHACPGRFFAANEVKIALVQLLLKYDFRLPAGGPEPTARAFGFSYSTDPFATMEYCGREPEVEV
ncbi:putative cytochrome P450 monooxygenase [Podospora appendiculata]|uniref:Cytochrome P450 monooxygenase n=1 Tax=Podospora appendiculata TaxID=314037 RepID=A0AAE1C9E5_9PEZI|nr:putative cytochrome P450 monooxygenase [Podospora appendiculata]